MDGALPARRPRPVADVPAIDPVALTRAWLVALVGAAPLARAAELPVAELARGGPPLCGTLLAAIGTDGELGRLRELAFGAARMTGAADAEEVVAAVEALRGATWRALRAALGDADPAVTGDVGDRLAHLAALATAEALRGQTPRGQSTSDPTGSDPMGAGRPPRGARIVGWEGQPTRPPVADPLTSLADELATGPRDGVPAASHERPTDAPAVRRRTGAGWDGHAAAAPPWLAAIVRQLERHSQDGRPFAVLLAEVDDLDRLLAGGVDREVAAAVEEAERALTVELAPSDLVVRERLGRWWLTTPERNGAGARSLAERVAAAVGSAVLHGVPLTASVGVAVCPEDGADLDALAGRADEGMYAARAAGVPVA